MTANWRATGLSHDLPSAVAMAAELNGIELVVWRSASGRLSAWSDRCPHRGMRLSHGFVRGETLSCIYHGWVYGTSGACQYIPAHPTLVPPTAIRVEAFSCVEADGVLWLAPAGTTRLPPDLTGLTPVRSLTTNVGVEQLRAVELTLLGDEILRGNVAINDELVEVCLLVQPRGDRVTLHALCAKDADVIEVSRWLDDLRRRAEAAGEA